MRKDMIVAVVGGVVATVIGTPIGNALSGGEVVKRLGGYTEEQIEKAANLALIQTGPRQLSPQRCVEMAKNVLYETRHNDIRAQDGNYVIGRFRSKDGVFGYVGLDCHSVSNEWVNIFIASSGSYNEVSRVRQVHRLLVDQTKAAELMMRP